MQQRRNDHYDAYEARRAKQEAALKAAIYLARLYHEKKEDSPEYEEWLKKLRQAKNALSEKELLWLKREVEQKILDNILSPGVLFNLCGDNREGGFRIRLVRAFKKALELIDRRALREEDVIVTTKQGKEVIPINHPRAFKIAQILDQVDPVAAMYFRQEIPPRWRIKPEPRPKETEPETTKDTKRQTLTHRPFETLGGTGIEQEKTKLPKESKTLHEIPPETPAEPQKEKTKTTKKTPRQTKGQDKSTKGSGKGGKTQTKNKIVQKETRQQIKDVKTPGTTDDEQPGQKPEPKDKDKQVKPDKNKPLSHKMTIPPLKPGK